ncbi:hypothetical protein D0865_01462 [Hortaea werneckii]|uniref:Cytochrome c oxidase subunit 12, mitochondrial n=1 Tax=Hortaea werneckii TaxID=91943 RepID=A0A3M7D8A0_HORWE|nr:hypothetical protein D0865_01462 [Hortaea werneckii]
MSDDEERVTMPFKFPVRDTPNAPRECTENTHRDIAAAAAGVAVAGGRARSRVQQNGNTDDEDPSGFDARFPNQNQTKHCWQNYVDYHKCILAKGEDFKPCRQFFLACRSLCPSSWCERWDDQRENGTFPARLDQ